MTEQEKSFKEVFKPIVEEIIDEKMVKLSEDDINEIMDRLIVKVDEIVARRIRLHIHTLLDAAKDKIKE